MNLGSNPTDNDAQALADLLSSRVDTLAAVARDVAATIEADQAGHRGRSEMADELIDSVTARIGEIAADCDDLNRILAGFRSLMETTPAPAASRPGPCDPGPSTPVASCASTFRTGHDRAGGDRVLGNRSLRASNRTRGT